MLKRARRTVVVGVFSSVIAASPGVAAELQILGFRFDPLRDGEPAVPRELRAAEGEPGFRLVQLDGPPAASELERLEAEGARVLQYYPHDAYLVWTETPAAPSRLSFVRWTGLVHPAYKINADLLGRTGLVRNVDVLFYAGGGTEETLAALAGAGANVLRSHSAQPDGRFHSAIVELPADAVRAVARLRTVLWLGYESPRPTLDDEMSSQIVAGNYTAGTPSVGYAAWLGTLGLSGAGVTWAVIDTGVDYDHPDLGPHIVGGYSFPGACSPAGQPGSDCSGGGHGTHVAGIVGGTAAGGFKDGSGFLYGLGIAPAYGIFAMNSLSASAWPPSGGWQEHSKRAVLGGAIGGNNSWTTSEGTAHGYQASERTHDFMVRDGNFDTSGVAEPFIEVFSAGNSGPGANTLTSPKEAKNLTVVANSLNFRAGNIDLLSNSSSRGPAVDGRIVPTVAAPGSTIASARNDLGGSCSTAISGTNNLYAFCSGTSMAAPHVSGAMVLATEWWRGFNAGANPSPAMAKALLVNTAVDMGTPDIPNPNEGWGRIHLGNLFSSTPRVYRDQRVADRFDNAGEQRVFDFVVPDAASPLKVSLAWSDAPGAAGANPALVNNLDLSVETGAATYLGNRFSAGWSVTGGSADALNNLENVFVANPGSTVRITVRATNLPGDGIPFSGDTTDQDFALVCSNCTGLVAQAIAVDVTGNGVFEPAETVTIETAWRNPGTDAVAGVTGAATAGGAFTLVDAAAAYGTLAAGATASCTATGDCYSATATGPRPGPHWDVSLDEALNTAEAHAWTLHIGGSFDDTPTGHMSYRFVETILHRGVTGGCGTSTFCPDSSTTRAQMAVFVLRSQEGPAYSPAACAAGPRTFADVPATNPFCSWVEELARRGVVSGCGSGNYCPDAAVAREQMPLFVLLTKEGGSYAPPACVSGSEMFLDVPAASPFCRFVEEFARRGITAGCGGGNYCPLDPVTRGQMSVFLTVGFSLALYLP